MNSVREDIPGPEAFARVIATLNREFDSGDCATSLIRSESYAAPTGTPFTLLKLEYEDLVIDCRQGGNSWQTIAYDNPFPKACLCCCLKRNSC